MNEKPAQALLKILRDSDRAVAPSLTELHPLGLEYDAELSALVSPEYLGFVVQSQESKRFYFYSKRERFYCYGEEWDWGDWQVRSISNVRGLAKHHIEIENDKFRQASDFEEEARWNRDQSKYIDLALAEFVKEYQKDFCPNGESLVPVSAAFRSETQDFLILVNNHVVCIDRVASKLQCCGLPRPFMAGLGQLPSKVYLCIQDAINDCIDKPACDLELLAEWESGYPVYGIVNSLHGARVEEASFLESWLSLDVRPASIPDIER